MPILAQLPLNLLWIDSRPEVFDNLDVPAHVNTVCDPQPEGELRLLPADSWVLILTHDHQLDFRLAETALKLAQFPYVGMIGSETKAKRFKTRLAHRQLNDAAMAAFVSPVGELSVTGKRPVEVAVSISAQIINMLNTTPLKARAEVITQ